MIIKSNVLKMYEKRNEIVDNFFVQQHSNGGFDFIKILD